MKLQPSSRDIWDMKYRLKSRVGEPVDRDIDDTLRRVAKALAAVEETPELQQQWEKEFLWALRNGAVPAGRILSNAGAGEHKPATALINCTVADTIHDSMDGILGNLHAAGMTLKAGCGIGYEFSTLRPKGAYVSGAGSTTSGPLPFMDIYDQMCKTVSSAGGRRGAQMGAFDVGHPDVPAFIRAKQENGRLQMFNLSLLITHEFVEAVKADQDWQLAFPVIQAEAKALSLDDPEQIVWRDWPIKDDYIVNEQGRVACRVYETVRARELWDMIMRSTYDFAEPGFIVIDEYNRMNNLWWCETIRSTNPCGEQGLPPNGACLLGSIDLTRFVETPFTDKAAFDFKLFEKVVRIFTRLLDNVVEISNLPLEAQQAEMAKKRRHGMGYFGLGSMLAMLKIRYGSEESLKLTEEVTRTMARIGWEEAINLSREKGPAPIMEEEFEVTAAMLSQRPEMAKDGIRIGDSVKGRVLHARYSRYMQRLGEEYPDLIEELVKVGARFSHHTSIAPTGTIALSLGNNASNGIEPSFSHAYLRNLIRDGKKTKDQIEVVSAEFLAYRERIDVEVTPENLPDYFVTADAITPNQHVDIQAAAQKWVDSSISKTINVPTEIPFAQFQEIYLYAVEKGLKGCTTFRFNPEVHQGVLVKEEELASTIYRFTLEDGTEIDLAGNETVEYDGETHTAANLYEAIKNGSYGRY